MLFHVCILISIVVRLKNALSTFSNLWMRQHLAGETLKLWKKWLIKGDQD